MKQYPNIMTPEHGRGFFGIGIYDLKTVSNLGTLWRSAHIFMADFIFLIGKRYETMRTDTLKSWKHLPYSSIRRLNNSTLLCLREPV